MKNSSFEAPVFHFGDVEIVILIYKGAKNPLVKLHTGIVPFHGNDGFGDLEHATEPDLSIMQDTPSSIAMNDIVSRYPKQVTLICVAPLTNLALAIRLFDDFAAKLKSVYIMGGNLAGVGNVEMLGSKNVSSAEFNFASDPEAAHIVLNTLECPMCLVPWETCTKCKITTDWRFNVLGAVKTAGIKLMTRAEDVVYSNKKMWTSCDSYAALAYLYPESAVLKCNSYFATVELQGRETRGQLVLDHMYMKEPNVNLIEEIDDEFFKKLLLDMNM